MADEIILIRPKNIYNYNNYPPLNLINLASVLKLNKYNVSIINAHLEEDVLAVINKKLEDCLFIGITLLTGDVPDAYRIMKFIKANSNIPIVVGGWHCTLFPEQMADLEYVDYVVAGEGEEHIVEIANIIRDRRTVNNKVFYKNILNIEDLPVPDYSLDINIEKYINNFLTDKLSEYARQPMRWLPYDSSRGCPSLCTFCINVVAENTRYRKKSAEKVVSEIEHIVKKYNISHLKIIDDNFFVDIKRVREICKGIVNKGLNITWDAECRCDYFNNNMLNDQTLSLAKGAGLIQLTLGVESGSMHTLKLMKKGITPEQGEYAVKRCDDYGIVPRCSLMIEVPGESMEDIKKTIAFVKKLRKYHHFTCGVQIFRPYPKCELTDRMIKEGLFREPESFIEWTDKKVIEMYMTHQYIRPWHINGIYSEAAAYYLTMESGVSLSRHMLKRLTDRLILKVFIEIARIRNKLNFYKFPIDRRMYKTFFNSYYQRTNKS
jgi:anaerobic magnesium-protoporphyrin IX monomethyl ester cyclase